MSPLGGTLWAVELKTADDDPTREQLDWLLAFKRVTRVQAVVVWPENLAPLVERLKEERGA